SSAPPRTTSSDGFVGLKKFGPARPSQNSVVNANAAIADGAWRPVGWPWMPAAPNTSSEVPNFPSGPGFSAGETEPPNSGRWQEPHATVLFDESCRSQNSSLPSATFAAVSGLSAGMGTAPKGSPVLALTVAVAATASSAVAMALMRQR